MKIFVTGGSGFIGSAFVRDRILNGDKVLNCDSLTYAADAAALQEVQKSPDYRFEKLDVCNADELRTVIEEYSPDVIVHFAAESHVDRSISGAAPFIRTNIQGTYSVLECALGYWEKERSPDFRLIHVSTDEVYGSLDSGESSFVEDGPYRPNSPYAASKAASDHLVRAWNRTFGLPAIITHCSNNYGPYQHSEKLIPHMILCAIEGKPLPIYGDGKNIRDWIHVDDHVSGLVRTIEKGRVGEIYNFGGEAEVSNLDLVYRICRTLDKLSPVESPYASQIQFVTDRKGHDFRYSVAIEKAKRELSWEPKISFEVGMRNTIEHFVENMALRETSTVALKPNMKVERSV